MSVHYKFKSSKEFSTVTFDGAYIALDELKQRIIEQKKLAKTNAEYDLEVINAQSQEAYTNPKHPVPRNTSVIVRRIPPAKATTVIETQVKPIRADEIDRALHPYPVFSETTSLMPPLSLIAPPTQEPKVEEGEQEDDHAITSILQGASTWT